MDTYIMNGTNAVLPMQGTNMVLPMQGTNMVLPMQGTNAVVPMQGTYGMYEVHPHCLNGWYDAPMQGIPDDWDDEDIEAYRAGWVFGDPDAMQGLFKKFKEKRKRAKAGNLAAKSDRQARRAKRRAFRDEKKATGTRFIDRFGGAVANVGEALKLKAQTGQALEDEGIDYDDEILEQRSAMAADEGETGADDSGSEGGFLSGLKDWWDDQTTIVKGITIAGGLYATYKGLQMAGVIESDKKKRK